MSHSQTSAIAAGARPLSSAEERPSLNRRLIAGLTLLALGVSLFATGIYHGFEHGSCSTTGYSSHYGPVPHCGKGVGWWMLLLMVGLVVAGAGAVLSGVGSSLGIPVLFVAVGAPFIALAFRHDHSHLLTGSSSSTGKLSAGIFGACFVVSGVVWGAIAGRSTVSRFSAGSLLGALIGCAAGVAIALAIGAGVSSAIGHSAQVPSAAASSSTASGAGGVTAGGGTAGGGTAAGGSAAAQASKRANAAITRAMSQAEKARKLAACVSAAGTNTARIQTCMAKYTP
jgi:hypothetical protein